MKTIALADREISVAEYSDFETNLQAKTAEIAATSEEWTMPNGVKQLRLTDVVVTFDDTQTPESEIEHYCLTHGFRKQDMS